MPLSEGRRRNRKRYERRRKAAIRAQRAAGVGFSGRDFSALKLYYGRRCAYCGIWGGGGDVHVRLTVDHVVPLAAGGAHAIDNVVPACPACNASKRDDSLLLWLRRVGRAG